MKNFYFKILGISFSLILFGTFTLFFAPKPAQAAPFTSSPVIGSMVNFSCTAIRVNWTRANSIFDIALQDVYSKQGNKFDVVPWTKRWQYDFTTSFHVAGLAPEMAGASALTNGLMYAFQINNINSDGSNAWTDVSNGIVATCPPTTLSASPASSTVINLSWTILGGATSYILQKWNGSSWVNLNTFNSSTSSTTDTGLTCNTSYSYRMLTQEAGGATGQGISNTASATTNACAQPSTVDIRADGSNGPITINFNASATISWSSTNASSCNVTKAGVNWSSGTSNSGTNSGNLTSNTTFAISCIGAGGNSSDSVTVNVNNPPSTADIKANSLDGPITIARNSSATISWSSTNASSCNVTKAGVNWSSGLSNAGVSSGNLAANTTFAISCTGTGGNSSDSVTVNVIDPSTADIKANSNDGPITITINTSATISWSSTNASSCNVTKAGVNWSSGLSNAGVSSGNLAANTTFAISCTGTGGNSSDSVTVNVSNPQPELTISSITLNPASPLTDQSVTATVVVANGSSTATTAAARVRFWSNLAGAPDFTTAVEAGMGDQNTGNIAGNGSQSLTFTFSKSSAISYTAYALVDNGDPGVVDETDDTAANNRRILIYTVSIPPVDFSLSWQPPAPDISVNPDDPAVTYTFSINPLCAPSWAGTATVNLSFTAVDALPVAITRSAISPASVAIDCGAPVTSKSATFTMTADNTAIRGNTYRFYVTGTCNTGSCSPAVTRNSINGSLIIKEGQWLETTGGDFFSNGQINFGTNPPVRYNSDFLLMSNAAPINKATSQKNWKVPGYGNFGAILSYAKLQALIPSTATKITCPGLNLTDTNKPTGQGVYTCNGNVTLSLAKPNFFASLNKQILSGISKIKIPPPKVVLAADINSTEPATKPNPIGALGNFLSQRIQSVVNWFLPERKIEVAEKGQVAGTTTVTFTISPGSNDGSAWGSGMSYPPPVTNSDSTGGGTLMATKEGYNGGAGGYAVSNGLARWDTSSIPDTATIDSATLTIKPNSKNDTEGRSLVGEWYDSGTIGLEDYTANANGTAFSSLLSGFTVGTDKTVALSNVTSISKTGFTGIRFNISGAAPTNLNSLFINSIENPPGVRLNVTYTVPADINVTNLVLKTNTCAGATISAATPIANGTTIAYCVDYSLVNGPASWTNRQYLNQATQPPSSTPGSGPDGGMTNVADGSPTNQIMATIAADNTVCTSCTASIFFDYNNALTESVETNNFKAATYTVLPSNVTETVVFVDGDLTLDNNLNYTSSQAALYIVNGQIKIKSTVTTINAYLYAENGICTSYDSVAKFPPLTITGGVAIGTGANGKKYTGCSPSGVGSPVEVSFQRNTNSPGTTAAELIKYDPRVLTSFTKAVGGIFGSTTTFTETSP